MSLDVKKLSPEERAQLLQQLELEQKEESNRVKKEREEYKEMVHKVVTDVMKKLTNLSSVLSMAKAEVFNEFSTLVNMKSELYGIKPGQQSHDFTNKDGMTVTIGSRVIDGWDDTVDSGIGIVQSYIDSLATNEETAKLVHIIHQLLKKDAKGNLKANRVLELQKLADELDDETFTEGVDIIRAAYRPVRSAFFIEASVKDSVGKRIGIPLSITSVPFPDGVEVNTDML
ncbi:MAG: DUF3164 family protein [Bacteroidota bacterium]